MVAQLVVTRHLVVLSEWVTTGQLRVSRLMVAGQLMITSLLRGQLMVVYIKIILFIIDDFICFPKSNVE